MKLYRNHHSGKLSKSVVTKLIEKQDTTDNKMVVAGTLIICMFLFFPFAEGKTLTNYTGDLGTAYVYQDNIYNYEQIINNTATMIKELKISNPDDIFFLITILIHDGFFSINEEYKYQIPDNWDIRGYEGMDIVKGYGVCRHEAEFLNRVLNECGYDATTVINYAYGGDEEPDVFEPGNHLVVALKSEDGFKIYDPTNAMYGISNDGLTIDLDNGYNLDLKPMDSYIRGYTDFKKILELYTFLRRDITSTDSEFNSSMSIDFREFSMILEKCRNHNLPFIEDICHRQEVQYGRNSFSK